MAYYNDVAQRTDLVERALGAVARVFEAAAERRAKATCVPHNTERAECAVQP